MGINYAAIVIAAIIGFAVGGAWYSPALFGKKWAMLMGHAPGEIVKGRFSSTQAILLEFVVTLVSAYVLGNIIAILEARTFLGAIDVGFWLWLGFQATLFLSQVWFENRSWALFAINAGHRLVATLVMAVILALWI